MKLNQVKDCRYRGTLLRAGFLHRPGFDSSEPIDGGAPAEVKDRIRMIWADRVRRVSVGSRAAQPWLSWFSLTMATCSSHCQHLRNHGHIDAWIISLIYIHPKGSIAFSSSSTDAPRWRTSSQPTRLTMRENDQSTSRRTIFRLHTLPTDIVSDGGTTFPSQSWRDFFSKLKVESNLSTAFYQSVIVVDMGTIVHQYVLRLSIFVNCECALAECSARV